MPEFIPRSLLILTAAVALIALFIGIRDYVGTKHETNPTVSMSAPSVAPPNPVSARKKFSTEKRRLAQVPAPEANAVVARSANNATGEPLIKEVMAKVESTAVRGRTVGEQPVLNQLSSRSSIRSCTPLPNSTKPRDVDAIYYQGWAREYGCGAD